MKPSIILATTFAAIAAIGLASLPASAAQCQSHRSVAVGKDKTYEEGAKKKCFNKLKSKGFDIYGQQNGNPSSFIVECQMLGGGGPSPAWKTYYQCICSGYLCKKSPFKPSDDPDLDKPKPKSNRSPGLTRIPNGSLGTRRAAPPSFRVPRMGPTIR